MLSAVGSNPDGNAGQIEWTLPLPNYSAAVAIADVFGDGKAQIVVSCQDGHIYGIGAPSHGRPAHAAEAHPSWHGLRLD